LSVLLANLHLLGKLFANAPHASKAQLRRFTDAGSDEEEQVLPTQQTNIVVDSLAVYLARLLRILKVRAHEDRVIVIAAPIPHGLHFEVLLILGSSTEAERLCIANERVFVKLALRNDVGAVGAFLVHRGVQPQFPQTLCKDNVGRLREELFGA